MVAHEITQSFHDAKLPLNKKLAEMLDEHFSHCTERRGCGFTQSTRFLSDFINSPPDNLSANDLKIFSDFPLSQIEDLALQLTHAGWQPGWRNLDKAPANILRMLDSNSLLLELKDLIPRVRLVSQKLRLSESRLFVALLLGVLLRDARRIPSVKGMPLKPEIGSCSQAEEFFLEIAHSRVRRGGQVNVVVDKSGRPVLLEKINLGESHSAVVVSPIRIFGVTIPAGGLCALRYTQEMSPQVNSPHGYVLPLSDIAEARFLRLTTLAVPPEDRARAFSQQLSAQIQSQMLSPTTTTIEQLLEFSLNELSDSG